jgi:hypothetical protein
VHQLRGHYGEVPDEDVKDALTGGRREMSLANWHSNVWLRPEQILDGRLGQGLND